jgi:hypothetical protein
LALSILGGLNARHPTHDDHHLLVILVRMRDEIGDFHHAGTGRTRSERYQGQQTYDHQEGQKARHGQYQHRDILSALELSLFFT